MPDTPDLSASAHGADGVFAATHWSVVVAAGESESVESAVALEKLCRTYWYPVYAWIRSRGHQPEEAKDFTQEFLAGLLRKESLSHVEREKGRFRTFLIRSIQYFLTDQHRMNSAAKRGGANRVIEWDGLDPEQRYVLEPLTGDTPDAAFDRRWSRILMTRAYERLAEEQTAAGHAEAFTALREFIGAPPDDGEYRKAAAALGLSENAVAVTVRRLRLRCREIIMEEIMQTVATRAEAEEELRALFGK